MKLVVLAYIFVAQSLVGARGGINVPVGSLRYFLIKKNMCAFFFGKDLKSS